MVLVLLLRDLDLLLAHLRGEAAFLAVAPRLDARTHGAVEPLDAGTEALGNGEPREAGEEAERACHQHDQDQRPAGEAERGGDELGQQRAEDAAGRVGERSRQGMQPQRLERAAGSEQHRESGERHREGAMVEDLPGLDTPVEPEDAVERADPQRAPREHDHKA